MEGETVIAGVDTHKDVHVLCLLDGLGRKIWSGSFGADPEGYDRLAEAIVDWQHLFGRFREGQPRFPELDRRHVAQRRVDPEVVVPVHVVRELGP